MRERDLERSEVARMAAQADEATRAAQDMKLQLDRVTVTFEFHSIVVGLAIWKMSSKRMPGEDSQMVSIPVALH